MSIEQDIKDLTAAVKDLTEAFISHTNDAKPSAKSAPAETAKMETKAPAKLEKAMAKKTVVKASEVEAKLAEEDAAEEFPYSNIQNLIKANVATKRGVITALLAKYKIKMATELQPEQYKQFFDELTAELGAEADLA